MLLAGKDLVTKLRRPNQGANTMTSKKPARRIVGVSIGGHLMTEKDEEAEVFQSSPLWECGDVDGSANTALKRNWVHTPLGDKFEVPTEEIAAGIVRCINQVPVFNAMVEALDRLVDTSQRFHDVSGASDSNKEAYERFQEWVEDISNARAALKLAKGAR